MVTKIKTSPPKLDAEELLMDIREAVSELKAYGVPPTDPNVPVHHISDLAVIGSALSRKQLTKIHRWLLKAAHRASTNPPEPPKSERHKLLDKLSWHLDGFDTDGLTDLELNEMLQFVERVSMRQIEGPEDRE